MTGMTKIFKTLDEQVRILQSKGLIINDEEETKALVDELFNDVTPDSEESQEVDDENTLAENVVNET